LFEGAVEEHEAADMFSGAITFVPDGLVRVSRLRVGHGTWKAVLHDGTERSPPRARAPASDAPREFADHVDEHRALRHRLDGPTAELRATLYELRAHLAGEERYFLTSRILRA
jgi:hypothetical protein